MSQGYKAKGVVRVAHSHYPLLVLSISTLFTGDMETMPIQYESEDDLRGHNYGNSKYCANAEELIKHLQMFEGQIWKFWRYDYE